MLRGLSVSRTFSSGIILFNAQHVRVTGNVLHDAGIPNESPGINVVFGSGNQFDGNVMTDNGGTGITTIGSDDNRIIGNSAVGNPEVGVLVVDGTGQQVIGNVIAGSPTGVIVNGDHNVVSGNQMTVPVGCGPDGCNFGISFEGGTDNVLDNNVITGGQYGIRVDAFGADAQGSQIRGNVVTASGADGIAVDLELAGPVLDTQVEAM